MNLLADYTSDNYSASTQSILGFQDAVRPVSSFGSNPSYGNTNLIYLFTDGCDSGGIKNCTSSCLDNTLAFSNISTFHNCMAYPLASQLYIEGNITANSNDSRLLDYLNIRKDQKGSGLHNDIIHVMQRCFKGYCTKLGDCNDDFNNGGQPSVLNSTTAFYPYSDRGDGPVYQDHYSSVIERGDGFDFAEAFCNRQPVGLNPDIGGIGVREARIS